MMTFTEHDPDASHIENINGTRTLVFDSYLWLEEEQRRATDEDVQVAYYTCTGIGYQVKARHDNDPVGPAQRFAFGRVTHITQDGAVVITSSFGSTKGQTEMLSPHAFHLAYVID